MSFVEYSKLCSSTQRRAPRTRFEMDVRRARETYEALTSFATDAGAGTAPDDLVRVVIVREDAATVSAEPSSSARLVSRRESLASSATAMKCSFRDCSTMVIDQRGIGFSAREGADAMKATRQLTAFATTKWRRKVNAALEVRNALVDVPRYVPEMLKEMQRRERGDGARTFAHANKIERATWDTISEVNVDDDGGVSIESRCGSVKARLIASHGVVFEVLYPVLIGSRGSDFEYVWQRSRFEVASTPERWSFPLRALRSARAVSIAERDVNVDELGADDDAVSELPRALFGGEAISGTPWSPSREDPKSWWSSRGLNTYDAEAKPWVEWTPCCTIWACACGDGGGDGAVFALEGVHARCVAVAQDERAVACSDDFIVMVAPGVVSEGTTSQTSSRKIRLEDIAEDDEFVELLPVVERLRRFERACVARQDAMTKGADGVADAFAAMSVDVIQREAIGVKGELVAYADGRVRGVFDDRTILLFDRTRTNAALILSDGSRVQVRIASPVTAKLHVGVAFAFANKVWPTTSRKDSLAAPSVVDVSANITRNDEWLQWYASMANRTDPQPPPSHALAPIDNRERSDVVASELAKTRLWLASKQK